MNRFVAMNTCVEMITSTRDDELGMYISDVLLANQHDFIGNIEAHTYKCESIVNAISTIKDTS